MRDELRLVSGRGRFLDDVPVAGALHMALVRSPVAHAHLDGVDASAALAVPGVRAVVTATELATVADPFAGIVRGAPPYLPLAADRVRYAGEPVAAVLADDRYAAEDGVDAVAVELEPLAAVVDPLRSEQVPWGRSYTSGEPGPVFAAAERVVEIETAFPRYNSTPLETYALIADWARATGDLTVHANFQGPFSLHPVMARALRLDTAQLRLVVAEDVGGSFGLKAMMYPYIVLAGACSRLAGAPVKWVEDRAEHLVGSACGTNRVTRARAAVGADGRVEALHFEILEDVGAYLRPPEPSCVMRSISGFAGPYAIEHGSIDVRVVLTNKLPTGLNRGYGGQQHIFTLERLMDRVADAVGLEPAELRRRNFLAPSRFPFEAVSGTRYDSGAYEAALDTVLAASGYEALRSAADDGGQCWVGVGLATAIHSSAANMGYVTLSLDAAERGAEGYRAKSGSRDWATVRVDPGGKVAVEIATGGSGQGHRAAAARIVAEVLGVAADDVRGIDSADTGRSPWSVSTGSYSSRFAVMTGNAVLLAAEALRDQLLEVAARVLDAPRQRLVWEDGRARDVESGATASLRALAGAVHWDAGTQGGELAATRVFVADGTHPPDADDRVNAALAYGFMADVAVVEVDKETLVPRLRRYHGAHDIGRTLDEDAVAGQFYGGVVHGLGGALLEEVAYDENGRPLARDFMDYRCPEAGDAPEMRLEHVNAPSPFNPLGVKGAGESSAMSAPAAIAAAVEHALRHTGVKIDALPVDPAHLWEQVRA